LNIVDHLALGVAAGLQDPPQDESPPCKICPVPLGAWDPLCHGLTSGELDAALINLPMAMDLFGGGLDIALVMLSHRGGSLIAGRTDLAGLAEFKGKSLLIPHRLSIQHMLMHKLMADRGMALQMDSRPSEGALRAEAVPMHLMAEMLETDIDGDIAGFISPDPFVSKAAILGKIKALLTSQALWKNHPCCGLVVRHHLLEDQDTMGGLVTTLFKAAARLDREISAAKGPGPEIINTAAQFLGQSPECVTRAMAHSGVTYCPGLLIPEKAPLITVQEYMIHTMGLLPSTVDLDAFVRPQFAKNALAELSP